MLSWKHQRAFRVWGGSGSLGWSIIRSPLPPQKRGTKVFTKTLSENEGPKYMDCLERAGTNTLQRSVHRFLVIFPSCKDSCSVPRGNQEKSAKTPHSFCPGPHSSFKPALLPSQPPKKVSRDIPGQLWQWKMLLELFTEPSLKTVGNTDTMSTKQTIDIPEPRNYTWLQT